MSKLICFMCEYSFQTAKLLIDHMKLEHGVPSVYKFKCKQNSSRQKFQNIHAFKKHFKNTKKSKMKY